MKVVERGVVSCQLQRHRIGTWNDNVKAGRESLKEKAPYPSVAEIKPVYAGIARFKDNRAFRKPRDR